MLHYSSVIMGDVPKREAIILWGRNINVWCAGVTKIDFGSKFQRKWAKILSRISFKSFKSQNYVYFKYFLGIAKFGRKELTDISFYCEPQAGHWGK